MKDQKHRPCVKQPDPGSDEFARFTYRHDGTAWGVYMNVNRTNAYQMLAKTVDSANDHTQCLIACQDEVNRDLTEFAMGLASESGEFADEIRKHIFQGHGLNYQHLAEELGDIAWFLAMAADALGYSLSDIFRMNIEKLIKRYPEGFDPERSVNR